MQVSPFLQRTPEHVDVEREQTTYADQVIPSPEQQRGLIETLRYHGYVRRGTLGSVMQQLGDWGRKYFPFIGSGWDGIGPRL